MPVVASALAALALIGTAGVATWQAKVSAKNAERANRAAANANAVQKVLAGMLSKADPEQNKNITATDRQLIDKTLANAERDYVGAPEILVQVLKQLGEIYFRLGSPEKFLEVRKKVMALLESLPQTPTDELVDARSALGKALSLSALKVNHDQALPTLLAARDLALRSHASVEMLVQTHCMVADQLIAEGKYEEADTVATEAVSLAERGLPNPHQHLSWAYEQKAATATYLGKFDSARAAYGQAQAVDATGHGRDQVDRLIGRANVARTEYLAGNFGLAKTEALSALAYAKLNLGDMEGTLTPHRVWAVLASVKAGQVNEAAQMAQEMLSADVVSGDPYRAGRAHFARGMTQMSKDDFGAAALSFAAAKPGLSHRAWWRRNLALEQANLVFRSGRKAEAYQLFVGMLEALRAEHGVASEEFSVAAQRTAVILVRDGKPDEARRLFNEACAWSRQNLKPDHPNRRRCNAYDILIAKDMSASERSLKLTVALQTLTTDRADLQCLADSLRAALAWAANSTQAAPHFINFPLLE